jgi:hypothetical protein
MEHTLISARERYRQPLGRMQLPYRTPIRLNRVRARIAKAILALTGSCPTPSLGDRPIRPWPSTRRRPQTLSLLGQHQHRSLIQGGLLILLYRTIRLSVLVRKNWGDP